MTFQDNSDRGTTPWRHLYASDGGRLVGMSEFQQEIQARMESAQKSLDEARLEGDDYLAQIRLGELESLQRLHDEHTLVA